MSIIRHDNNSKFDFHKVLEDLTHHGISVIDNFLNQNQINKITEEHKNIIDNDLDVGKYNKIKDKKSYLINFRTRDLIKENLKFTKTILENKNLNQIILLSLGKKFGINNFISNFTDFNEEKKEIFPLHMDYFKSNKYKCIKVYFYLSDTTKTNGALRYIPQSHNLIRFLLNNLINHEIKDIRLQEKIRSLGTTEKGLKLEEIIDLLNYSEITRKFNVDLSNYLLNVELDKMKNSNDFIFEGKAGTAIIFDSHGLHGGGKIEKFNRNIFRIHFFDKNYKIRYLYDQCNLVEKIKSKIINKF